LSSQKPFANSFPPINNSNLSAKSGLSGFLLERGETSTGYSVTNVRLISLSLTVSSNISSNNLPLPQLLSVSVPNPLKYLSSAGLSFKSFLLGAYL